jgi:Flp pilus assembly protein TadD
VAAAVKAGDDLLNQDRLKEAISSYVKATHTFAKSSLAHQRLGHAYALDHRLGDAETELRSAISLDPMNDVAHFDLGWICGLKGEFRTAVREERAAIALKPTYAPAYVNLGIALTRLEDYDAAAQAFAKAITLEPQNVDYYVNMASLQARRGNYQEAVSYYRRAIALDHNDPNAHIGLAAALAKLGDARGQIVELRKAAVLDPDNASVHGKLGWAYYEARDWKGAFFEGVAANGLRAQQSSSSFLGTLLTAWAALFLLFGLVFAATFLGSRFKPQHDETVIRSFFLIFYKDRPGRFVITSRRLIFVPEAFSQWFGATRLSVELVDVESFYSRSAVTGGRLALLCTSGDVIHFAMPVLVLEPLMAALKKLKLGGRADAAAAAQAALVSHSATRTGENFPVVENDELFEAPSFDPDDTGWIEVVSSTLNMPTIKKEETRESQESGGNPVANDNGHAAESRST